MYMYYIAGAKLTDSGKLLVTIKLCITLNITINSSFFDWLGWTLSAFFESVCQHGGRGKAGK